MKASFPQITLAVRHFDRVQQADRLNTGRCCGENFDCATSLAQPTRRSLSELVFQSGDLLVHGCGSGVCFGAFISAGFKRRSRSRDVKLEVAGSSFLEIR
jgi:hypothetical protein